ncbi:hypothetical protein [Flavobacterium chilense]|uniref:Uncharacterized protein n=1 Tax=Flavobacterium chilense TaxID=946677 RepID=A0A1M7D0X9_9FLAO|nr:hypothetical protein [Flavobacterium chilense]SHL73098.1 hypothetical protein SAMN05444484_102379 [Flavobacterium chilense]
MEQVETTGNIFTTKSIGVFVFIFITIISIIAVLYYLKVHDLLFQLIGFWQHTRFYLVFMIGGATILTLWLSELLYNRIFGNVITMSLNEKELTFKNSKQNITIPLQHLRKIRIIQKNNLVYRIDIVGCKKYYISIGTIFLGLKFENLTIFIDKLTSKLQNDFKFKLNIEKKSIEDSTITLTRNISH